MPPLAQIQSQNAALRAKQHRDIVAVFAGATGGIGLGTLQTTTTIFPNPTIYILGRSASRFAPHLSTLQTLNPSATLIFLERDPTLLSEIDKACAEILARQTRIDYLFMSPGLIPLNGPQPTLENLETCFVLSYYGRIRLIQNLLPLLRQAPSPRVLSVLAAGREKPFIEDDLGFEKAKNWSAGGAINQITVLMSLGMEYIAEKEKKVLFLHSYPGLVRTDIVARLEAPEGSSWLWALSVGAIKKVFAAYMWVRGMAVEESGERQAWILTSGKFETGKMVAVNEHCEEYTVAQMKVVEGYKTRGFPERVWGHTMGVLERRTEP
jgi:NAD(P)-dependent dehydrogenase (short-subunit alcohol dehydrogenase family)